jgi:cobalt-zinc-cadmium resistance protein CzcA
VSTVRDAQAVIAKSISVPEAYRIEWGGEFEHFTTARRRLMVVVPIALALILFMLWTAFGEMRPALLIFLNVPFAIVGGIYAIWLRSIPFSISAGVGFIAAVRRRGSQRLGLAVVLPTARN